MKELAHKIKSRAPVVTRRFSEIGPKISLFLRVVGDHKIRHNGEIDVSVVPEPGFPVDEPDAVSIEEDTAQPCPYAMVAVQLSDTVCLERVDTCWGLEAWGF